MKSPLIIGLVAASVLGISGTALAVNVGALSNPASGTLTGVTKLLEPTAVSSVSPTPRSTETPEPAETSTPEPQETESPEPEHTNRPGTPTPTHSHHDGGDSGGSDGGSGTGGGSDD